MDVQKLLQCAYVAASNKKATELNCIDVTGLTDVCDYHLICSGDNDKQTQAIADAIQQEIKQKAFVLPYGIEGKNSGQWIVLDYGALIVHVFLSEARKFYAIDTLYPKAKKLSF